MINQYNDGPHSIVHDIHLNYHGVLHRFNNRAGVPYFAIYHYGVEHMSCERPREAGMIQCWNESGWIYDETD